MAKQNQWKLIKKYEDVKFPTSLWFNKETMNFEIWRNHACVKVLAHGEADKADKWVEETENSDMTLNEYLHRNNLSLTELEVRCLNYIFGEGSFYEENGELDFQDVRKYGAFIGWDLSEEEIPGCRGALSSLKKKGVLTIVDEDDGLQAYYIHFEPEFLPKTQGYHKLLLK